MTTLIKLSLASLLVMLMAGPIRADESSAAPTAAVRELQTRWARVNYELTDKAQIAAFEKLVEDAEKLTQNQPEMTEAWIWSGIIKSTFAGAKGGLGALSLAKKARSDLEKAMSMNADALNGSAYASLGTLYFKVPGWPLGFGSDKKAREMLEKALTINPNGIDPNYFYGDFLRDQGEYSSAEKYLVKALNAPPRPNRPLADSGRRKEIQLALAEVRKKMKK